MSELIGLREAGRILGVKRARAYQLYRAGVLKAEGVVSADARPRPVFKRSEVEELAAKRAAKNAVEQAA